MTRTYVFARDASKEDWCALPRAFKAGETVQRGSDQFGLCRDDAKGGVESVPCTIDGKFVFTVPVELLRSPDGGKIMGDYWPDF